MPQSRGRRVKPGAQAKAKARARRLGERPRSDFDIVMQFGAVADLADEESVAEVRQVTHDRVIAATANHPGASGVVWRTIPVSTDMETCRELIAKAGDDTDEARKARDGLIEFLEATPTAGLIVATVEVPKRRGQDRHKAHLS
jgi:hypothetical protein